MDSALSMAAAAVQGAFQYATQVYSAKADRHAIKKQNVAAKELSKYQYDLNLEQWNRANEYNSPAAQMERLKAAGLNPNLVYGNGTDAAGKAAPSPSYEKPEVNAYTQNYRMADALSGILDQALKAAQVQKVAQETENLGMYQRNLKLDGDLKELDKIAKGFANSKSKEEAAVWRSLMDAKIANMFGEGQVLDARYMDIRSQTEFREKFQKPFIESQTKLFDANRLKVDSDRVLNAYKAQVYTAQITDLLASAGLKQATVGKVIQEINNLKWDSQIKAKVLEGKSIDNEINSVLLQHGVNLKSSGEVGTLMNLIYGLFNNGYQLLGVW